MRFESVNPELQRLGLKKMDEVQQNRLSLYVQELLLWNRKINLISRNSADRALEEIIIPSFYYLKALLPVTDMRILDLGSGAGIPGVPIKVYIPSSDISFIESNRKRGLFIEHMIKLLEFDNAAVYIDNAEKIAFNPGFREGFDIVVSRAFSELNVLAEIALPFLKTGGRLITLKKELGDFSRFSQVIDMLGGRLEEIKSIEDFKLVILGKVRPTPQKYPRRPGIPRKRPLV